MKSKSDRTIFAGDVYQDLAWRPSRRDLQAGRFAHSTRRTLRVVFVPPPELGTKFVSVQAWVKGVCIRSTYAFLKRSLLTSRFRRVRKGTGIGYQDPISR